MRQAYADAETAESKAREYLDANLEGKKAVVMDMKERFEEMGNGNRESANPRDPYNRKLVAAWASYWLVASYYLEEDGIGDRTSLINTHIEKYLKADGFQIRGPLTTCCRSVFCGADS